MILELAEILMEAKTKTRRRRKTATSDAVKQARQSAVKLLKALRMAIKRAKSARGFSPDQVGGRAKSIRKALGSEVVKMLRRLGKIRKIRRKRKWIPFRDAVKSAPFIRYKSWVLLFGPKGIDYAQDARREGKTIADYIRKRRKTIAMNVKRNILRGFRTKREKLNALRMWYLSVVRGLGWVMRMTKKRKRKVYAKIKKYAFPVLRDIYRKLYADISSGK